MGTSGEAVEVQNDWRRWTNKWVKMKFKGEKGWVPWRHLEVPNQLFKLYSLMFCTWQRQIGGLCSLPASFILAFQSTLIFPTSSGIPPTLSLEVVSCLILSTLLCFQCSVCMCARLCAHVCVCAGLTQRSDVFSALCLWNWALSYCAAQLSGRSQLISWYRLLILTL